MTSVQFAVYALAAVVFLPLIFPAVAVTFATIGAVANLIEQRLSR
ncbi:hypothetical protein [Devosia sp. FJ2-5-3]|nr:hypothetical protein [Devosia sp. FJ2-5-3]WEJ60223.1 hypothetical protein N0P34_09375 [Devosia sp. FJ2-5-3]